VSELQTFKQVNVEITRGKDVVTVDVPKHEVEVLRAVHTPPNVRIVGEDAANIDLDPSCDAEIARLQRKYVRINSPDPVLMAFRDGPRALEREGFILGRAASAAPAQSLVKDHAKLRAAAEKQDATKDAGKPGDDKK
jgi:hypothetical protein